jgi:hypothetical protein
MSVDISKMKKKVLCVYHGKQTLWKDDLMMHNESEVKMKLLVGRRARSRPLGRPVRPDRPRYTYYRGVLNLKGRAVLSADIVVHILAPSYVWY